MMQNCPNTKPPVILETARLILRPWKTEDLAPFAHMNANAQVMQHFPQTLNTQESDALAEKFQQQIDLNGWGFWALELKQTGQFIGFTGLHFQPDLFEFSPCTEIGWRLAAEFWHQGYATEAAGECLRFAFEVLQLKTVKAFTAVQNKASENVMLRLGMQHQGYFNHPKLNSNSPLLRHTLYCIKQADFLKNHGEYGLNQSIHIEPAQRFAKPQ